MKLKDKLIPAALILLTLSMVCLIISALTKATDPQESIVIESVYTVSGSDVREKVQCQFDPPLKHVTLIMNWYDTNEEMYADYILMAEDPKHKEIWGWSSCMWQPDDSWAACDVFVVVPDFVHADMNVDTIGHEVLHGACGDYHE